MAPTKQQPTQPQQPTADDLLFLLSIVSNPNSFIAEHETSSQSAPQSRTSNNSKSISSAPLSWQHALTSLPGRRRDTIVSLQQLDNARAKWSIISSARNDDARQNTAQAVVDGDYHGLENKNEGAATVLLEVEHAASAIRMCATDFLEGVEGYKKSMHSFWNNGASLQQQQEFFLHDKSQLETIGCQLAHQLICQLDWDERLALSILTFLDEELYTQNNINQKLVNDSTTENKLRTWSDAMAQMIKIDKSLWDFVEREVYDETELTEKQEHEEIPELLNGEASTQYISVGSSPPLAGVALEEQRVQETNGMPPASVAVCENTTTAALANTIYPSLQERITSSSTVEEAIEAFMHGVPNQKNKDGRHAEPRASPTFVKRTSSITSILLVGEEGCGKTHLLSSIQRQYNNAPHKSSSTATSTTKEPNSNRSTNSPNVTIVRPNYPVDLVGSSIGSTEDRLIALFAFASRAVTTSSERNSGGRSSNCIIMLDDIDRMFSLSDSGGASNSDSAAGMDAGTGPTQYYIGRRCKALFITILDAFREHWRSLSSSSSSDQDGHLLLLCTARSGCGEVADRFDRIFRRGLPDERMRRRTIVSCLSTGTNGCDGKNDVRGNAALNNDNGNDVEALIALIVHHSAGRSVFELSQCCRETILSCAEARIDSTKEDEKEGSTIENIFQHRLQRLDQMLQTKSPSSLRGGSLDGVVDMRVYTPDELKSKLTIDTNTGEVHMPLLGAEAERAHKALMNVVITPLCRSDDIRDLLYGGGGSGTNNEQSIIGVKPIRVGALLAGAPGVGKTSLAYHCAALAANTARVSLIDVSCTSLIHKEIGGSERAVQHLFHAVRAAAPCILLLDGIECVAMKRGNDNTSEGTMDRVLSTFLTEMDGIETAAGSSGATGTPGNVAVIGITHNPELIDPSLLRPGRLEKTITLGAPDFEARRELVSRQIKEVDFDFKSVGYFDAKSKDDVARFVAMASAGMSAVEVIAICREASMECLRELNFEAAVKPCLTYEHFQSAIGIMKGKVQ